MVSYQIKTLKTNESRKQGADELWVAVLARAAEDALKPDEYDRDLDRRAARYWFRSYSVDFRLVCELAGRNARYVREKMLKRIGEDKDLHKPTVRHEAKAENEKASKMKKLWNLERAWRQVKSLKYAQYQKPYNERRHEYD
tara:strand:- start:41 stop:463 length:423 start_codon:yes stop_codon:yes gene_type:complete